MSNVTIITGFFDIGDTTRSVDWYMDKGKFLLEVDSNMIIFTDKSCHEKIKKIRGNLLCKTHFVIQELSDFLLYTYKEKINNNRKDDSAFLNSRNTSDYFILVCSKFEMMKKSVELNPFKSSHFIWIDFGIQNTKGTQKGMIENVLLNIRDKFSCCYIHYRTGDFMKNYQMWHRFFQCGIAGGILSGNVKYINEVCDLFNKKCVDIINLGYGRAEEQIITEIESENPELFDFYVGDYYGIVANYINITQDIDCILNHFVANARLAGNNKYSYKVCSSIEDSISKGLLHLNESQKMKYFDEYFISAWYINKQKCVSIIEKLADEINKSVTLCQLFKNNINYYINNFDFVYSLLPSKKTAKVIGHIDTDTLNNLVKEYKVFIYNDHEVTGSYLLTSNPVIRPLTKIKDIKYDVIL